MTSGFYCSSLKLGLEEFSSLLEKYFCSDIVLEAEGVLSMLVQSALAMRENTSVPSRGNKDLRYTDGSIYSVIGTITNSELYLEVDTVYKTGILSHGY